MTDYFALLDLPRRPRLDGEELKARYHERTLKFHPDTATTGDNGSAFAQLNEAYQTLRDPHRRLQHLLSFETTPADAVKAGTVPESIQQLFPRISETTHRAAALIEKLRTARNALSRGLLKGELLSVQAEVEQLLAELRQLDDQALSELQALDERWLSRGNTEVAAAHLLQLTFTYLARWIAQLEEKQFQLSQG